MAWFHIDRLNWPPDGDLNSWADFLEMLCLFSEDNSIALEEFADYLTDDATKDTEDILRAVNFNEHFLFPSPGIVTSMGSLPLVPEIDDNDDGDENEEDGQVDDSDDESEDAENLNKEKIRGRLILLFQFIEARQNYFGAFYPFKLEDIKLELIAVGELSLIQRMYLVLLFSSEMRLYSPANINKMGHLFEVLCRRPFYQLVPAISEKRFFGAGGGVIIQADYNGNLRERITELAQDLNVEINKKIVEDPDELGPSGDAGLDWVAWMQFEDNCDHHPTYFGQCACGSDWKDKQQETSLERWYNFLHLSNSVQCIHFMPRSFRRKSLQWFRAKDIHHSITLIDRYRLLKLLALEDEKTMEEILQPYTDILNESMVFKYAAAG